MPQGQSSLVATIPPARFAGNRCHPSSYLKSSLLVTRRGYGYAARGYGYAARGHGYAARGHGYAARGHGYAARGEGFAVRLWLCGKAMIMREAARPYLRSEAMVMRRGYGYAVRRCRPSFCLLCWISLSSFLLPALLEIVVVLRPVRFAGNRSRPSSRPLCWKSLSSFVPSALLEIVVIPALLKTAVISAFLEIVVIPALLKTAVISAFLEIVILPACFAGNHHRPFSCLLCWKSSWSFLLSALLEIAVVGYAARLQLYSEGLRLCGEAARQ
ncbi:hypothetical protein BC936DRAFT_150084 [Jimgerdemannia flammicorona]|uniref:Uncharacterized protein n=1 Tax=Jimgerdemannia flammicorona TaxID=994334 RepID=A0A433CZJ9_9FUNG|nr:hypothetical protein BC936DRAFT_150084 [Jimgerdemannia flammicorona]